MLNVPGYADDSMLFMMRYGALAKVCYDLIYEYFFFRLVHAFGTTTLPHFHPPLPVAFTRPLHHNHKNARSP